MSRSIAQHQLQFGAANFNAYVGAGHKSHPLWSRMIADQTQNPTTKSIQAHL